MTLSGKTTIIGSKDVNDGSDHFYYHAKSGQVEVARRCDRTKCDVFHFVCLFVCHAPQVNGVGDIVGLLQQEIAYPDLDTVCNDFSGKKSPFSG